MAEEKTEQPSAKRLRDARQKGQVAKSQDVPSAMTVIVVALYLLVMGPNILEQLMVMTEYPMQIMSLPFDEALRLGLGVVGTIMFNLLAPFLAVVMAVALVANIGQVGVLFSMEAAMPKLENISPSKWFKKTFAIKNLIELLKNILKVSVVGYVVYIVFVDSMRLLFQLPTSNIWAMWSAIGGIIGDMLLMAAGAFCVIAAADYVYQRFQFTKQNMMTKDEVKREYKESEGDPQIKGQRKQLHQEMLNQNTLGNVRKAKVLVTNPTHFAIALDYDKEITPLPFILAKGEGALAQRMIKIAEEEGIPIMRNVPLAHSLFENGTENAYIPKDLIGPVAEVLKWVQSIK